MNVLCACMELCMLLWTQYCREKVIDVRGAYVTPELNNELQCNVGNMWEKIYLVFICIENRVT